MKKQLLIVGLSLGASMAMAQAASASLLVYEPFDQGNPGDLLAGGAPGAGLTNTSTGNQWFDVVKTSSHAIQSGNLPSPFTAAPSHGNSLNLVNISTNSDTKLHFAGNQSYATTSNTFYYSALLKIPDLTGLTIGNSNVQANNDGIVMFGFTTPLGAEAGTNWAGELVIRQGSAPGTYNLGIRASDTNKISQAGWTGDITPDNSTHLVVVRYAEGSDATDDTGYTNDLWLDPSSSTFGVSEASVPSASASAPGSESVDSTGYLLNGIQVQAGIAKGATPDNMFLDELRVGTTWADVTPVPEPVSVSLVGIGALGLLKRRRKA